MSDKHQGRPRKGGAKAAVTNAIMCPGCRDTLHVIHGPVMCRGLLRNYEYRCAQCLTTVHIAVTQERPNGEEKPIFSEG